MTITRTHLLPGTLLAALALALAGSGAQAGAAAKSRPTAANLGRFVLAKGDLPAGYKPTGRMQSASPGGCVDLGGDPAAARTMERRLGTLGFKRCASASFERKVETAVDEDVTTTATNQPGSEAILMRDGRAAAKALPVLRRALLASFTGDGVVEAHSVPATALGDQATRGVQLTYDFGALGTFTGSIYIWRHGPVVGWVFSSDILGDFDEDRTLQLARKLDARIAG